MSKHDSNKMLDIEAIEAKTMKGLKDFQKATVNRIDYLFRHGQKRVLVADEVGMGKTLIARGVIVKATKLALEEGKDFLNVAYICSNSNIASQNVKKLRVTESNSKTDIQDITDTRLSMLHIRIAEQALNDSFKNNIVQLIPLTPGTSFHMTGGGGTVQERALMFAILTRLKEIQPYKEMLEDFLVYYAKKAWRYWAKKYYEERVSNLEKNSKTAYPDSLIVKIYDYNKGQEVLPILIEHLQKRTIGTSPYSDSQVLHKLRIMFARIGAELMSPDLVIMDEFQRFRSLLESEQESETGILAQKFLSGGNTKVLLLSATPYKLYSTLEEIDETGADEHYREFLQLTDFLFTGQKTEFKKIWSNYSTVLQEINSIDSSIIQLKRKAEDALYEGVCRTERISVMENGDYTDDSSVRNPLVVSELDIKTYLAAGKLLQDINAGFSFPLDYVKSCPFPMSFMRNYKVKERIEKYFKNNPGELKKAKNELLWLDEEKIKYYRKLPVSNARLEKLTDVAFSGGAELLLWVPPSKPYYSLQGPFKHSEGFSKILVFSAWEMVPRMIGVMISYEAERKTIGRLGLQKKNLDRKSLEYDAENRYPAPRLQFSLLGGQPRRMNLFTLLYPSKTLASLYQPVTSMNEKQSLAEVEKHIKREIRNKLEALNKYKSLTGPPDESWYYLAPMLMDGKKYVKEWLSSLSISDETDEDRKRAFSAHLERLKELIDSLPNLKLGRQPRDLESTLVDMALGSPAVCIYRSNGFNPNYASSLAKVFINYFNTTESTAIIELAAGQYHTKKTDDNTHWQDLLLYCKDGCFQAMFDEYLHLIKEEVKISEEDDIESSIQNLMTKGLRLRTASYDMDTYKTFRRRCKSEKRVRNTMMRAHYAVGFVTDGEDAEKSQRRENVRNAFNSPLRPFVLASTSIGQEGLDFHNYCRKIVHWNLPSNPIDIEQREGRINRYKCLAIRQNVAKKYGNIAFEKDIWEEMFFEAAQGEKKEGHSDLVPYWCFGNNQDIKIERIAPMYPMSRDGITYDRLIKILSLYRLSLGQARQEELLEHIFHKCKNPEELKKLFINLSPFSKEGLLE